MKGGVPTRTASFGAKCTAGEERIWSQFPGTDDHRFDSFRVWARSDNALWIDRAAWVTETPAYLGASTIVSRDTTWGSDGGKGWCVSKDFADTFDSSVLDVPCWPCWEFGVAGTTAVPCRSQFVPGESIRLYSFKHGSLLRMSEDGKLGASGKVTTAVTDRRGIKIRDADAGAVSVYSDDNLFLVVDGGFGQIALFNAKYKRFVRMSDVPAIDSTSVPSGTLPADWNWERFVALDDVSDGSSSLFSRWQGRFLRMTDKSVVDPSAAGETPPLRTDWTWERWFVLPK